MLSPADVLNPDGLIARRLANYEHRPPQLTMAEAVMQAIDGRQHLMVEAATGVGKSFGYLVPAILAATAHQESGDDTQKKRIVVSTHTISLQEQLVNRDIPLIQSVLPREFSAVLAKGRGNYVSLRRMQLALRRAETLFPTDEEVGEVREIRDWAARSRDGSRADLERRVSPGVWDEVASDSGNCLGRKCPSYKDCFYFRRDAGCKMPSCWSSITPCFSWTLRCGVWVSICCPTMTRSCWMKPTRSNRSPVTIWG